MRQKRKKITSKIRRERAKKKIKKVREGYMARRKYITLTCSVCGEEHSIHTNNPSIYTEEVKKNWKCLQKKCRGKNGKV